MVRSRFETFHSWNDTVIAIKREFLPPKYDFKLLTNISNHRQISSETFSLYLTMMQSLFKHLSIPVTEQHKLCIMEENMLSKYAIATSVLDIDTLDQISSCCTFPKKHRSTVRITKHPTTSKPLIRTASCRNPVAARSEYCL